MNVRLIASTVPCQFDGGPSTAEELIVYCARVSNPSNQSNMETAPRLLQYCIRHGHWSVFEQASMTVEIKTSRAIAAQLLRHKSFSFQEFSQRYSEAVGIEPVELRRQADKNRQSSTEVIEDEEVRSLVCKAMTRVAFVYDELLNAGVARECARMVLPLATSTTLYMAGTCRSWIHYLQVRLDEHTQKEHREIAQAIDRCFAEVFPTVHQALKIAHE
jgi:thymidylate synthase (FAD)